ncbi:MAG: glycosyltransferase family 4 protein [Alphaproteobacteria bacterium]
MLSPMAMSSAKTILQVLPALISGGVERGTVEITSAIRDAGMKPLVASSGGPMIPHVHYHGGEHITLPLQDKHPLTIWKNAKQLENLIRERGISLIHARSRAPAWAAYLAAKSTGIPLVTTVHGAYGVEHFLKRRYNRVMTKGARVIAISHYIEDYITREYHPDPAIIRLIPRGVDETTFNPEKIIPDRIITLSRQWRLTEDHPKIILVPARISPIKGHRQVIDALSRLADVPFLCIFLGSDHGHEDYRRELEKEIRARGLEGRVRIAGNTNFMNEAYSLSDLVLIPSIKPEAFGRTSIEAQTMGKLVVAFDHGGVRETIIANETGYLVPPGDSQTLAEAIRFGLSRSPEMIQAMSDFARDHVRRHFSLQQMKDKTIKVYRELLG